MVPSRVLPNNFRQVMGAEKFVCLQEVTITKEPAMRRERRRVSRLEDEVFLLVDERLLAASVATPE